MISSTLEILGLAALTTGTLLLAGIGPALLVGGGSLLLIGYSVDDRAIRGRVIARRQRRTERRATRARDRQQAKLARAG